MLSQDVQLTAGVKLVTWTHYDRGEGTANKWAWDSHGMMSLPPLFAVHPFCRQMGLGLSLVMVSSDSHPCLLYILFACKLDMHGPCPCTAAVTLLIIFAGLAIAQRCSACSILPFLQASWHRRGRGQAHPFLAHKQRQCPMQAEL